MPRNVSAEGDTAYYDLYLSPGEGITSLVFPDELGPSILAQALLVGRKFTRILDRNIPQQTRQPRTSQIVQGLNQNEGTLWYAPKSETPIGTEPAIVISVFEAASLPQLSPDQDSPRSLNTVRHSRTSRAAYGPAQDQRNSTGLSFEGRFLLDSLNTYNQELLLTMFPLLANPEYFRLVGTLTEQQAGRLTPQSFRLEGINYSFVAATISILNTLGHQASSLPLDDGIPF